jgi:hypothetical protein
MFEAYKIGVTLSLTNHVSHGLALMARDFVATEAQATLLQKRIHGIRTDALKGGLMLGAGIGILALFKAPLEEAKKFDQALGKFKLLGLSDDQNADAVKFVRAMDTMGTSYVENMKLMTEAQGVFRESGLKGDHALAGAKLATPMLAKIQFASSALDGESQARMHTQSLAMLRFVEMRGGLKDADSFNKIADSGWKAVQSSGGNVNFEQLRQFMARGGVAAQGLSDKALYAKLEPIIGELKGSTAGNAWMTAYNRLVGGVRIPNQVAHLLADNGVWDKSKIEWNAMGGIKRFDGNPLKDMKTFSTDPAEFYEKTILPMYAKMNGGKGMDINERSRENTMIFGRTGGMMFSLIDRQLETIHRSVGAWEKAKGVDQSVTTAGGTLAGKEVALHAQWAKVLNDLGNTILPMAISGVENLTSMLKSLDGWINRNQTAVKALTWALGLLAGGLMIRGSVLLLSAAFRGLGLAMAFRAAGGPAVLGWIARGLTSIGSVVGLATMGATLAAIGAAFAGWKLGSWFYDAYLSGTKFSSWIGSFIAHLLAPFSKDAAAAIKQDTGKEWYQFGPKLTLPGTPAAPGTMAKAPAKWEPFKNSVIATAQARNSNAAGMPSVLQPKIMLQPPQASAIAAGQARPVSMSQGNDKREPRNVGAPYANGAGAPIQVVSNTYLDGRLISQTVTEKMVRDSMRPTSGMTGFDGSMSPMYPSQAR